jgi:integrase
MTIRTLPEVREALQWHAEVTGTATAAHLEAWMATLDHEPKTVAMKRTDVERLASRLPLVEQVTSKAVQAICVEQLERGAARSTINRALGAWRGYWSYLQAHDVVPDDLEPFQVKLPSGSKKAAAATKRIPFAPADVVRLWLATEKAGDRDLADLIKMAAYTGARIEELCSLTVDRVDLEVGSITIINAKTAAGERAVPIHPALRDLLRLRVGNRSTGLLLSSLRADKYGDYSNAMVKRFGRLKVALGYDGRVVFHSIRKTVATLLENAGVIEGVAADILGHEKKTMTYGLYSGGTSLAIKQEAIREISYPD